ncbi:DUF4214 domain-containing protein [Methylobacterium brachiatum]
MADTYNRNLELGDVLNLAIALSEQIADMRHQGQSIADDQAKAVGTVASLLREHRIELPMQIKKALFDIIEIAPKGRGRSLAVIEYIQSGLFESEQISKHSQPFVSALYRIVLAREAEDDAIRHWAYQLNTGAITKKQLLRTLVSSEEFRQAFSTTV